MNALDATWLLEVAVAYSDVDKRLPSYFCGIDARDGRRPIIVEATGNIAELVDAYSFVTDDRASMLAWLCQPTTAERFRVLVADFDLAEAGGSKVEAFRVADQIIELARAWSSGIALEVAEIDPAAEQVEGED